MISVAERTIVGHLGRGEQAQLVDQARGVIRAAPLLVPSLPGMTVRITNAGPWGWWAAPGRYEYVDRHPGTGKPWPPIPDLWREIFHTYAAGDREPDCGHVVWYRTGAKLGRHRDKTERDLTGSVVTVSLGDCAAWTVWDAEGKQSTTLLESGAVVLLEGGTRNYEHSIGKLWRPVRSSQLQLLPEAKREAAALRWWQTGDSHEEAWSPLIGPGRLAISIRSGAGGP